MSKYSKNDLVEMAYLYLVAGMTQREIEDQLHLPASTVSQELKPFGITGHANNSGRSGWGARGNHCGLASYERMGFEVTRKDVRDFLFGSSRVMTDEQYFAQLKSQHDARSAGYNDSYSPSKNYVNHSGNVNHEPASFSGIGGAIAFIVVVAIIAFLLEKIGLFRRFGIILMTAVKVIVALIEAIVALGFIRDAMDLRKKMLIVVIAFFSVWGFAVMFFGDGLLWGAGIWGIGLFLGWLRLRAR